MATYRYFPEAETGAYNLACTSDWTPFIDLSMWVEEERTMACLTEDIKNFYNTLQINI